MPGKIHKIWGFSGFTPLEVSRQERLPHLGWGLLTGFTLMELLVVVTIIVVLASMLAPSLQKAREKAKYARWLGIKHSIQLDSYCVAYYTFEKDNIKNNKVENVSPAASKMYRKSRYNPHDLDGEFGGGTGDYFPTFVIDGGRFGKGGLRFDGDNDYVDCGDNAILDVTKVNTVSTDITIEAWVKGTADLPASGGIVWKFLPGAGGGYYDLRVSNKRAYFYLYNSGPASEAVDASGLLLNDNRWHHVVAVRDYGNKCYIYVDGVEKNKGDDGAGSYSTKGGNLRIGINDWDSWGGLIDEVTIYSRALTENEIKQHYKMGRP